MLSLTGGGKDAAAPSCRSICDGGHEGVLRLGDIQTGALYHDGAVALNQNGIGLVAGNTFPLIVDHPIQTDVIGSPILAHCVQTGERLTVLSLIHI